MAFGHFLAMSGEESLAQGHRELKHPAPEPDAGGHGHLVSPLLFTAGRVPSYALIPDDVRLISTT
jgi:hypothetical protein